MNFDQAAFDEFVLQHDVVGFFKEPIVYKSGRAGNCYVNWRNVLADAYLTDRLTDFVLAFIQDKGLVPDCLYGVPESGTKLGVITQFKWAKASAAYGPDSHVLSMGRAKPKDHGEPKDKFFVGMPRGKTIVLEDTTTTGGSLLSTLADLQAAGVDIVAAVALTNRNEKRDDGQTVPDALRAKGVPYYALSSLADLLPKVFAKLQPGPEVGKALEEYFQKYGEKPIALVP